MGASFGARVDSIGDALTSTPSPDSTSTSPLGASGWVASDVSCRRPKLSLGFMNVFPTSRCPLPAASSADHTLLALCPRSLVRWPPRPRLWRTPGSHLLVGSRTFQLWRRRWLKACRLEHAHRQRSEVVLEVLAHRLGAPRPPVPRRSGWPRSQR